MIVVEQREDVLAVFDGGFLATVIASWQAKRLDDTELSSQLDQRVQQVQQVQDSLERQVSMPTPRP